MIDTHCHILWDIDDGPDDLPGALAMARLAVADGISRLIAAPHIREPLPAPEQIAAKVTQLNAALAAEGLALEVVPGGECLFNLSVETIAQYTLNGSRYVLVEFPHDFLPGDAGNVIFTLQNNGLVPIISHPERNLSIIADPQRLRELVEHGALVQMTADSLTGGFGGAVRSCARYLVKKRLVHFLASDGHATSWRPPVLSAGLKAAAKLIGNDAALMLVTENPRAVLMDENIDR